jgi:hypothetical protein
MERDFSKEHRIFIFKGLEFRQECLSDLWPFEDEWVTPFNILSEILL